MYDMDDFLDIVKEDIANSQPSYVSCYLKIYRLCKMYDIFVFVDILNEDIAATVCLVRHGLRTNDSKTRENLIRYLSLPNNAGLKYLTL